MIKYLLIIGCLGLFIVTFLINKKVKGPKYSEEEDEICASCSNTLCKRSKTKVEECEEKGNEE